MSDSVVFSNQKGGVGKSTLSVLYAFWLADEHDQSVCFVDLDTQGNASKTLRRFATGHEAVGLFSVPNSVAINAAENGMGRRISLISATKRLADVELSRPEVVIPAFKASIEALEAQFDTVVIDTPPTLGLRMSAALIAASRVVCPIELEEYSVDGVTDMLKAVYGVRQRYNARLQLAGIVLNRFNSHSVRQRAAIHQLATAYSEFVIPHRVSTRSAIPEALSEGKAVWELSKSSAREASAEVRALFEELDRRIGVAQGAPREEAQA